LNGKRPRGSDGETRDGEGVEEADEISRGGNGDSGEYRRPPKEPRRLRTGRLVRYGVPHGCDSGDELDLWKALPSMTVADTDSESTVPDDGDAEMKGADGSDAIGSSFAQALLENYKNRKVQSAVARLESMICLKDPLPIADSVASAASDFGAAPISLPATVPVTDASVPVTDASSASTESAVESPKGRLGRVLFIRKALESEGSPEWDNREKLQRIMGMLETLAFLDLSVELLRASKINDTLVCLKRELLEFKCPETRPLLKLTRRLLSSWKEAYEQAKILSRELRPITEN
jgi:hypothetical protein